MQIHNYKLGRDTSTDKSDLNLFFLAIQWHIYLGNLGLFCYFLSGKMQSGLVRLFPCLLASVWYRAVSSSMNCSEA